MAWCLFVISNGAETGRNGNMVFLKLTHWPLRNVEEICINAFYKLVLRTNVLSTSYEIGPLWAPKNLLVTGQHWFRQWINRNSFMLQVILATWPRWHILYQCRVCAIVRCPWCFITWGYSYRIYGICCRQILRPCATCNDTIYDQTKMVHSPFMSIARTPW